MADLTGNVMTKALGMMVGLGLALFVFSQVIDAILPTLYTCANTSHAFFNTSTCCLSGTTAATCVTAVNYSVASALSDFSSAVTLWFAMLPIIGLLGVFSIVWYALKKSDMV